jgi:hypothetical protein
MLKRKKDKKIILIPVEYQSINSLMNHLWIFGDKSPTVGKPNSKFDVKYQSINSLVNRLWIFGDKSPTVGKPNSKFDVKYATCVRSPKNVYT